MLKKSDTNTQVFESRWGWHPCSHEDYLKLKKAHKLLLRAYKDIKVWIRWERKDPKNRKGKEPVHPSWLTYHGYQRLDKKVLYGWGFAQYNHKNLYLHILKQYQNARTPIENPEDVTPLDLPSDLDETIKKLEAFYAKDTA